MKNKKILSLFLNWIFSLGVPVHKTGELKPMQPGDVDITFADISKAGHLLNYKPATDMATGIKKFITWYKAGNM